MARSHPAVRVRQDHLPQLTAEAPAVALPRRALLGAAMAMTVTGRAAIAAQAAAPSTRVAVFGDSLGDGLWAGLTQTCHAVTLARLAKVSSGLVKTSFYDWPTEARRIASGPYAGAIICIGLNDQQTITTPTGRFPFGTPGWDDAYGERVAGVLSDFARNDMPLVWVGLPRVREARFASGVAHINEVVEQVVRNAGGIFVPTWDATSSPRGYDEYLPDETGRKVNMRASDGNHFTSDGYRFLARLVMRQIQPDCKLHELLS